MKIAEETYLEHFGVKGMRWGVRKKRKESNYTTAMDKVNAARYKSKKAKKATYDKLSKKEKRAILLVHAGQSAVNTGLLSFGLTSIFGNQSLTVRGAQAVLSGGLAATISVTANLMEFRNPKV